MRIGSRLAELTHALRTLGATDPESWARSEIEEGIPQLARFLFLRQAWRNVVSSEDRAWIEQEIDSAKGNPAAPGSGAGIALRRLLAAGADPADLTEVVRVMQWRLLHSLCYLLDDPGVVEPEAADVAWGLFEIDADGQPLRGIGGLHESVLETDPSRREMGP